MANEKIFDQKILIIFLEHLCVVELTSSLLNLRCQQSDIVPIICH